MVNQVQIVGILMIVQGALASLMGILYAALGPAMFALVSMDKKNRPQRPEDETLLTVLSVVYVVLGILVLIVGILNVMGGIRILKFRRRTLAIIALFSNIIPVFTCYCAPTAIGIMIYGLIVLFNRDVARAFELAEAGEPPESIRARFAQSPRGNWDRQD